jgi:transposase
MRRAFFQFHASTKSPLAAEVLARVAALYAIEAEIRGHPAEHRRRVRQERSRPIVDALHAWLLERVVSGRTKIRDLHTLLPRNWQGRSDAVESAAPRALAA